MSETNTSSQSVKLLAKLGLAIVLIMLLWPLRGDAAEAVSFNTTTTAPLATKDQDGFQDEILIEVFRRQGRKVITRYLPGERSLINLNKGVDDGTVVRIAGLEKTYTNFRIVPEAVLDFEFVAFTLDQAVVINNWADLKPYSVSFVNGWKIYEKNVQGVKQIVRVRDQVQLFQLLAAKRTDIVLYEKWSGLYEIKKLGLKNVRAHPLATRAMYMYLHKKNEAMIPDLTAALKSMKSDGTIERIYNRILKPLLEN